MQIYFHSRFCSYLSRVPILVEGTVYVRCLGLGFLGGQSDAGDLKCLCVLSIQSHCFLAEIRMETAWYLEMYDVSFRRHTQISHVHLGQQQQSLSCDVILLEDFGILLQLSITYTAHTNTHTYVSVIAGTLSVNWINFYCFYTDLMIFSIL